MGLSSVSALHGAMWVAEQKGLFRKHGIETEIIVTGQGATAGSRDDDPLRVHRRGSWFSRLSRSGGNGYLLSSHHDRFHAKLHQGQSRQRVKISQGGSLRASPISSITKRRVWKSSERNSASIQSKSVISNDLTTFWRRNIMKARLIPRCEASRRCSD